jgi:inosine-uridine nucleoside N-ribohydrolase
MSIIRTLSLFPFLLFSYSCNESILNRHDEELSLQPVREFILDADTGNEMDDLYAIVRSLIDEKVEIIALTSAHFNNVQLLTDSLWHIYPTEGINTLRISQEINENILKELDRKNIPHPEGCDRIVGYSWGYYEGAPVPRSDAVDFIIQEAIKHSPENKLNILCVGPVTNVAAAILIEPGIEKNIRLFALSMRYDKEKGVWNKNTFNARNDINALDLVLDNENLEFIVIPGNVSGTLTFEREKTLERLSRWDHPVAEMLANRWDEVSAGNSWIMWDLALVEAVIHPEMATLQKLSAPPENGSREVFVYTDIDEDRMREEFWNLMKEYFGSGL